MQIYKNCIEAILNDWMIRIQSYLPDYKPHTDGQIEYEVFKSDTLIFCYFK